MVIFDFNVREIAAFEFKSNAPRESDSNTPFILPTSLKLVKSNSWWFTHDLQIAQVTSRVHDGQQCLCSHPMLIRQGVPLQITTSEFPSVFPTLTVGSIWGVVNHNIGGAVALARIDIGRSRFVMDARPLAAKFAINDIET